MTTQTLAKEISRHIEQDYTRNRQTTVIEFDGIPTDAQIAELAAQDMEWQCATGEYLEWDGMRDDVDWKTSVFASSRKLLYISQLGKIVLGYILFLILITSLVLMAAK